MSNKFSKPIIKESRKELYEKEKGLENENEEQEKKQHAKKFKKIKKFFEKLQKKYHDRGNQDYKGIRYIKNLFNEDYYKPIKTKGALNNN